MSSNGLAVIIDNTLQKEEYSCNICNDIIVNDTIIGLFCNPSKHIFCYTCILDWYKTLKKQTHYSNYSNMNMCPLCMKYGGRLPVCNNEEYIKGIHNIKPLRCGTPLASNPDKKCSLAGRYGGKCSKHKHTNLIEKSLNTSGQPVLDSKICVVIDSSIKSDDLKYCSAPLKSKKGEICKNYGKYNGRCGIHKTIAIQIVNEPDNVVVI